MLKKTLAFLTALTLMAGGLTAFADSSTTTGNGTTYLNEPPDDVDPFTFPVIDGLEVLSSRGNYTWDDRYDDNRYKQNGYLGKSPDKNAVYVTGWFSINDYEESYSAASFCRLNNEEICERLKEWYRNFNITDEMREEYHPGMAPAIYIPRRAKVSFFDDNGEQVSFNLDYHGYGLCVSISNENYHQYRYAIVGEDCPLEEIFMGTQRYLAELDNYTDWDFLSGDVNMDGKRNISDVVMLAAYIKGVKELNPQALKYADVNADDSINVSDIQILAGSIVRSGGGIRDEQLIAEMLTQYVEKNDLSATIDVTAAGYVIVNISSDDPAKDEVKQMINAFIGKKLIAAGKVSFNEVTSGPKFNVIRSNAEGDDMYKNTEWFLKFAKRDAAYAYISAPIADGCYLTGSLCEVLYDNADDRLRNWYDDVQLPEALDRSKIISTVGGASQQVYFFDSNDELVNIRIQNRANIGGNYTSVLWVNGTPYPASEISGCPAEDILDGLRDYIDELDSGNSGDTYQLADMSGYNSVEDWFAAPRKAYEERSVFVRYQSAVSPEYYVADSLVRVNDPTLWRSFSTFSKSPKLPEPVNDQLSDYLFDGDATADLCFLNIDKKLVNIIIERRCFKDKSSALVCRINGSDNYYRLSDITAVPIKDIYKDIDEYLCDLGHR